MSFDMNDAEPQKTSELIPDGTFAKVMMTIRPGGIDGESEIDRALLKGSKDPSSDVRMIDAEFTVTDGRHARRKFWQNFTVAGGKVDEHGASIGWKISKGTFRAMIDSALGLDPNDMSDAAKEKRILRGLADLGGITFVAKIKVETKEDYPDANKLDRVVLPNEPEWKKVMAGEDVPASPSRARPTAKTSASKPAWAGTTPTEPQPTPAAKAWSAPASNTAPPPAKAPGPAWLNT